MALNRVVSASVPIPMRSNEVSLNRAPQGVALACSVESALSTSPIPVLALPKHWAHHAHPMPITEFSHFSAPHHNLSGDIPPFEPDFISQAWSYRCHDDAPKIIRVFRDVLESQNADIDNSKKWRIDGSMYVNGSYIHFVIFLFHSSDGSHIIEVQRRQGDPFAFRDFFNRLSSNVSPHLSLCPLQMSNCSGAVSTELSRGSSYGSMDMVEGNTGTLSSLLEMISSKCIDVQREAMRAMARVSSSEPGRNALVTSKPALEALRELLQAHDSELVLCTVTTIANLVADNEAARIAVLHHLLLDPVLLLLQSPVGEISRQAARTLACVSRTHASRFQLSARQIRSLERCCLSSDEQVRECAGETLSYIESAGALLRSGLGPSRSVSNLNGPAPLSV